MIKFDNYTGENTITQNLNWPCILDHSYRILLIGNSRSGKNALLNLINHQPDIDKIYLHAKISI